MDLTEYVCQTLLEITNGVVEAQRKALLYIAPGIVENEKMKSPSMVKFEIVVTVNKDAKGGLRVWSLGDLSAGLSAEHSNRVSFEVPVYFQAPTERNSAHFLKRNAKEDSEGK